ncbi:hypothetical protein [Frigoriglobus tundricola]|uniref:Uncharacterized protein n=1 Tax=Frigoriglobus tundricola TaxID=2774151 RepID=A0A6M5YW72_9BACT|nr:hypothetical protein [Frigoriglobus tundricola]QJW97714.1 hypothetical protein FTUN_5292 [Frigoriglobus tundricola]
MTRFTGWAAEPTGHPLAGRRAPIALLALLTAALFVSHVSIARGQPEPPKEANAGLVRGRLLFQSAMADFAGTIVGREFDPRKYIAGHPVSTERAIWSFDAVPRGLTTAPGDVVSAKLTCSTVHTVKAAPGGVPVVVRVVSHTCPQVPPDPQRRGDWLWVREGSIEKGQALQKQYQDDVAAYRAKKIDPEAEKPDADGWKAANTLAEKYGYYEVRVPKVLDGVETTIDLPAGVFRNARKSEAETDGRGAAKRPRVSVFVKCETAGVLLGVAEPDLSLSVRPAQKR